MSTRKENGAELAERILANLTDYARVILTKEKWDKIIDNFRPDVKKRLAMDGELLNVKNTMEEYEACFKHIGPRIVVPARVIHALSLMCKD